MSANDHVPPSGNQCLAVVAVSRSQPKTHTIHSQPTKTAIVRSPSLTPLLLSPEYGIEGHKSAVHDAQVYAFFAHHYDYWTSRLKIDRHEWDWAHWGENLTIRAPAELDECNTYIGDRWIFSNARRPQQQVILEVCGGRNPCSRLAWRCGQPASWLAQVAKTGFCGVYLRVIRGGSIETGDTASITRTTHSDKVAVASIAQCSFSSVTDPATRTLAERILQVPGLQNMNQQIITRKMSLIEDSEAKKNQGWAGWRELEVSRIVEESYNVKSFYLTASDAKPLSYHAPGQYLTVKLPSGAVRCWSISSWSSQSPQTPSAYRLTVKKGPAASSYLHTRCEIGDKLLARAPLGQFVPDWSREFPPRQIYISAGIGITPILSMIQAHLSHQTLCKIPALLVHVARNSQHDTSVLLDPNMLHSDLIQVIKFYTEPIDGADVLGENHTFEGRPTSSFFEDLLKSPYEIDPLKITPIELPGPVSAAYVCGPPSFISDTRSFLEAAKLPAQLIHTETFARSQQTDNDAVNDAPAECTIRFYGKRREARWSRDDPISLLEVAERVGLQPEFGCRMGDCGACEMKIMRGKAKVWNSPGTEAKDSSGMPGTMIRTCCSRPHSTLLELEF